MSAQPHNEIAPFRRDGTAAATHAHHLAIGELPRRLLRSRIAQAVVTLGVCLAVTTAALVNVSPASSHVTQASLMNRAIRAFETKGYAPIACTRQGTLMRNSHTNRLVTVRW
jgi:hypothetical protein